jgi:hypothetical protein
MNSDTIYNEAFELFNRRISPVLITDIPATKAKSYRTVPGVEGRPLKFHEIESENAKAGRILVGDYVSLALVENGFEIIDGGYPCLTVDRHYNNNKGVVTFSNSDGAKVTILTCDANEVTIQKFQNRLKRQCKKAGVDISTIPFLAN